MHPLSLEEGVRDGGEHDMVVPADGGQVEDVAPDGSDELLGGRG